ncbi:hypothetical protein CK203_110955 [Vitis vinifera]|uniref:MULE transposase domain-containing protein n=1 Tax=Vitis vinifera TaxID=29760 RepID=A0A438CCH0_VITVI|nr:hypothetical protein CK203_110955 [Vitis vinifera]
MSLRNGRQDFCYIHEGGELVKTVVGSIEYKGGRTNCIVVSKNISHSEFVSKVCGELNLEPNSIKLDFTVKFDPSCLLPLHDDADIVKMFKFNDMFCRAYVCQCTEGVMASLPLLGFVKGCRPIIAIDSTHMSGPYGGALFSATALDANDSMFPLAFGVMSSENYEDWLWFLEKLKIVVETRKLLLSQIDILLSFVVFLRCLALKTMPIATVT